MFRELLARKQNYALILLLFALLAYSLIGFSVDVSAARGQEQLFEQPEKPGQRPRSPDPTAALHLTKPRFPYFVSFSRR
jgi:hypothetical protein